MTVESVGGASFVMGKNSILVNPDGVDGIIIDNREPTGRHPGIIEKLDCFVVVRNKIHLKLINILPFCPLR